MTNLPPQPSQLDVSVNADLLILRLTGDYTIEVARYVTAIGKYQIERYGYKLILMDVVRAGPITSEARRAVMEQRRQPVPDSTAIVGANFAVRTLAMMVIRAIEHFSKKPAAIEFFASESDARQWLDTERSRYAEMRAGAARVV